METKETIIFEVDVTSYEKSLALLTNSINALKADQKAYLEDSKKGIAGAAEAYEKVTVQLKNQQQAYRTTQAALQGYVAGQKSGVDVTKLTNNSIQQNRDLLKQLTAQYITTRNASPELAKAIKNVSDKLKEQEGAIGDTRRNVGNYAEGFKGAFSAITSAIPALKGLQTAQLGVNAAMEANPIGLVVVAIQSLTSVLTYFNPIMEAIEKSTAAVSAAFGALINGGNVLEAASEASRLKEELNDLEDAQNGVTIAMAEYDAKINTLLVKLRNKNLTEKEAAKISSEIAKLSEDRFNKESNQKIAELKNAEDLFMQKNNITKKELDALVERGQTIDILSEKELAAIEKVSKDSGIAKDELIKNAIESQKFEANRLEKKLVSEKEETDSTIKNIAERRAAIFGLEAEKDKVQQIVDNRNVGIKERFDREKEKAKSDKEKEAEQQRKEDEKNAKAYNDLQQYKLDSLKKADDERRKLEAKAEADRLASLSKEFQIENEFLQRQLQLDLTAVDLSVATEEEKARRKDEIQINSLERQLDLAIQYLGADGNITKAELQGIEAIKQAIAKVRQGVSKPTENDTTLGAALGLSKDDIKETQNALQQIGDVVSGIGNLVNTVYAGRIQNVENERDAEIQAIEQSTASQEEKDKKIKELNRKTAMETYEIQKQQFEVNKAISIVQTLINTAAAVVAQLANPTPYAGIALAALAAATGVAQVAVIAAQQPPAPPKFATGVIGLNGEGTETSDSIPALLSKNESVMTAKATKRYHRQLAWMEQSVGNTPNYKFGSGKFANGLIGGISTNAGFDTREIATSAMQRAEMTFAIKEAMLSAPAPVVSVKEFNRVNSGVQRSVRVSEV